MIQRGARRTGTLIGLLTALLAMGGPAWAYWLVSTSGTAHGSAATSQLGAPVVSTTGVTTSNVTINVTSAGSGPTPTGYRVARTSASPLSSVCTITGATGSCNDTSPVQGQTNTYAVYAQLSTWEARGPNVVTVSADVPAAATRLAVTSTPVSGTASATANLGPITVQRQDSSGNPVAGSAGLAVSLASSSANAKFATSANGTGITQITIPSGQSSTTFYYGDKSAGTPTVTVSASGLTSATQTETIAAGSAAALAFGQQPTSTTAGTNLSPAVTVRVLDQFGNLTNSTASVVMAIGTNPGGGTLAGTTAKAAQNGTATFDNLSINKTGSGYTLTATSTGLSPVTSSSFAIAAAAPDHLCITANPSCTGGSTSTVTKGSSTLSTVGLFDQFGNAATATTTMAVTVQVPSGSNGAITNGSLTIPVGQSVTSGSFTYKAGNGAKQQDTVTASSSGVTSATWIVSTP